MDFLELTTMLVNDNILVVPDLFFFLRTNMLQR